MSLQEFAKQFNLKVFTPQLESDAEIKGGYVSDLLSDVMGNAKEGEVWITLQSHINVVAIASLKELAGVIFINGNRPDELTILKAIENGVLLFGSPEPAFIVAGKLYNILYP